MVVCVTRDSVSLEASWIRPRFVLPDSVNCELLILLAGMVHTKPPNINPRNNRSSLCHIHHCISHILWQVSLARSSHRVLIPRLRIAIRSCCMGSERRNFPSKAAGRQRLQSWPNLPPGATMVQVQPGGPPPYMYGPKYVRLILFLSGEMLTVQRSSACRLMVEWGQMARGTGMYPLRPTIGQREALVAPRHNRSDRNHPIAISVLTGLIVSIRHSTFSVNFTSPWNSSTLR